MKLKLCEKSIRKIICLFLNVSFFIILINCLKLKDTFATERNKPQIATRSYCYEGKLSPQINKADIPYSIQFPKKWQISEENDAAFERPFSNEEDNSELIPQLRVAAFNTDLSQKETEQCFDDYIEIYSSDNLNGIIIKKGSFKMKKKRGKFYIVKHMHNIFPAMSKLYLMVDGHSAVFIRGSVYRNDFKKYEALFDKSAQSFFFK